MFAHCVELLFFWNLKMWKFERLNILKSLYLVSFKNLIYFIPWVWIIKEDFELLGKKLNQNWFRANPSDQLAFLFRINN
jgi:hypothetical protein